MSFVKGTVIVSALARNNGEEWGGGGGEKLNRGFLMIFVCIDDETTCVLMCGTQYLYYVFDLSGI